MGARILTSSIERGYKRPGQESADLSAPHPVGYCHDECLPVDLLAGSDDAEAERAWTNGTTLQVSKRCLKTCLGFSCADKIRFPGEHACKRFLARRNLRNVGHGGKCDVRLGRDRPEEEAPWL